MNFADEIDCQFASINHYDVIPFVIKKISAKSYLEIGCAGDDCFRLINVEQKIGVDPQRGGTHRMTSDQFFAQNKKTFDVIFVDGLHEYTQVKKDVEHALQCINPGGIIFMHDVLPANRYNAVPRKQDKPKGVIAWNGNVWRAAFDFASRSDLCFHLVTCRHGVGIIQKKQNFQPLATQCDGSWQFYLDHWKQLPSVSTLQEIEQLLDLN